MNCPPRILLRQFFDAALAAADPAQRLPALLPPRPKGRTVVIGAGKASAKMARAVEDNWDGPLEGLVVTRYGHATPCARIEIVEAAHPVPDDAGLAAAKRIQELVRGLGPDDLVLCLISGGGSALLSLPAPGITLADKRALNRALLKSGAAIDEMNCVRKHLSAVKGGRLALACAPARVVSYVISDVPGDDPAIIASGPTVADPSTRQEARAILKKYGIDIPPTVAGLLDDPAGETVKPGDPRLDGHEVIMVARPQDSLEAACQLAYQRGLHPVILSDCIEGEARDVAKVHAAIARQVARFDQPGQRPCALLSGGETTVTVTGSGRGGRNAEFSLALALALDGLADTWAIACDTDGIDGIEDAAGALVTPDTLGRAADLGLDAKALLANNDAYSFFSRLDDLVVTGPTRTNVNDFRAILVL